MVTLRRIILGTFREPSMAIIAIVLTGLEEAGLRTTMIYRDRFFDGNDDKPTATELVVKRKIWASSIVMSMFTEFVAIIGE